MIKINILRIIESNSEDNILLSYSNLFKDYANLSMINKLMVTWNSWNKEVDDFHRNTWISMASKYIRLYV